jgi:hypothetical protein
MLPRRAIVPPVASIHVRFVSGDEEVWELLDQTDVNRLVKVLAHPGPDAWISFPVASEREGLAIYGFVGLSMADVASWHVDGMTDTSAAAALWAELQIPEPPR